MLVVNITLSDPLASLAYQRLYEISENAGLYYMAIALVPLVLYFDCFLPEVNDAESKYLRRFTKSELLLVTCQPLAMLLALAILKIISFGSLPSYTILTFIIIFVSMIRHPGFITLKERNETTTGIRYDVISKAVRSCYFICLVSLYAFTCALTGPGTFGFIPVGSVYNFPMQSKPPWPNLKFVDKNGVYAVVDLRRGYLTHFMYYYVPESVFFLVMFYFSHLYLATLMRCLMFYVFFALDTFTKMYRWITSS